MLYKKLIGLANRSDKLAHAFGILDAFVPRHLNARADIDRQRFTTRAQFSDAIDHVGSGQPTTQDEVSVDVWRKQ